MILLAASFQAAGEFMAAHSLSLHGLRVCYSPAHLLGLDLKGAAVLSVRGPRWPEHLEDLARRGGAVIWTADPPPLGSGPQP